MKTAKDIFTEAFALVRNPETWTQRAFAQDARDRATYSGDPEAVRWCSAGAVNRVCSGGTDEAWEGVYAALNDAMGGRIFAFNDKRSHAEVVAAWERAGKANGWLP